MHIYTHGVHYTSAHSDNYKTKLQAKFDKSNIQTNVKIQKTSTDICMEGP